MHGACAFICNLINWEIHASLDSFYCQTIMPLNMRHTVTHVSEYSTQSALVSLFFCSDLPVIRYAISYAKRFFLSFRRKYMKKGSAIFRWSRMKLCSPIDFRFIRICANCTCNNFIWHWDAVVFYVVYIHWASNGDASTVIWILVFADESGTKKL